MATVKEHINKPVIAISDGRKLGKIRDLYLDAGLTRVVAVYLGRSGIIERKQLVIERHEVQTCGMDAWLVPTAGVVADARQVVGYRDLVPARTLRGRKILSEGGTQIATVDSVILDGECNVKGFTLARVTAPGPLSHRRAIALGAISGFGSKTTPMTTTLAQAESMGISSQNPVGEVGLAPS